MHEHEWQSLSGWCGRYRCASCGALGYRGIVIADIQLGMPNRRSMTEIIPYKCSRKGCGSAAVRRNPRQLCAEHSP